MIIRPPRRRDDGDGDDGDECMGEAGPVTITYNYSGAPVHLTCKALAPRFMRPRSH
jgi:hypothetical protein